MNSFYATIVSVCTILIAWLLYELKKLREYENKDFLDKVYKNAEKDVGSAPIEDLVDRANARSKNSSKTPPTGNSSS